MCVNGYPFHHVMKSIKLLVYCSVVYCLECRVLLFFFFFKQKTAYEMRISDWSSDVCSSDLLTLTGVEGKTFVPMALTVIIALAFAFILSLTFVPAMIAIWLSKKVEEKDGRIITWLKKRYEPGLDRAMKRPTVTIGAGVASLVVAA